MDAYLEAFGDLDDLFGDDDLLNKVVNFSATTSKFVTLDNKELKKLLAIDWGRKETLGAVYDRMSDEYYPKKPTELLQKDVYNAVERSVAAKVILAIEKRHKGIFAASGGRFPADAGVYTPSGNGIVRIHGETNGFRDRLLESDLGDDGAVQTVEPKTYFVTNVPAVVTVYTGPFDPPETLGELIRKTNDEIKKRTAEPVSLNNYWFLVDTPGEGRLAFDADSAEARSTSLENAPQDWELFPKTEQGTKLAAAKRVIREKYVFKEEEGLEDPFLNSGARTTLCQRSVRLHLGGPGSRVIDVPVQPRVTSVRHLFHAVESEHPGANVDVGYLYDAYKGGYKGRILHEYDVNDPRILDTPVPDDSTEWHFAEGPSGWAPDDALIVSGGAAANARNDFSGQLNDLLYGAITAEPEAGADNLPHQYETYHLDPNEFDLVEEHFKDKPQLQYDQRFVLNQRYEPVKGEDPALVRYGKEDTKQLQFSFLEAGVRGAPIIVLVHGVPTNRNQYLPIVHYLKDFFHVFAVDKLGMGDSSMPLDPSFDWGWDGDAGRLYEFYERQLGGDRFFLLGDDWGGGVVQKYAEKWGNTLHGLILLDPIALRGYPVPEIQAIGRASQLPYTDKPLNPRSNEEFVRTVGAFDQTVIQILKTMTATTEPWDQFTSRHVLEPYADQDYEAPGKNSLSLGLNFHNIKVLANRSAILAPDLLLPGGPGSRLNPRGIDFTRYSAPVLILWGDKDNMMPAKQVHELALLYRKAASIDAQYIFIPDASHFAGLDQPVLVSEYVTDFCINLLGPDAFPQHFLGFDAPGSKYPLNRSVEKEALEAIFASKVSNEKGRRGRSTAATT